MRRFLRIFAATIVSSLVGCSGSGDSPGGSPTDGAVLPDFGLGDTADAGDCPPAPTKVIDANAGSVDVSGDEVVFMDHDAGVDFTSPTNKTKAVRKVRLDGTGDTVLYTALAKHQINDVKTVGTTVYFLESERDDSGNEATTLFSMPVGGGTPTVVGKHQDPTVGLEFDRLDSIVAVDADAAWVVRGAATGEASLWRFALAGGAETLVYRGSIKTRPQKVADEFFFASGAIPSGVVNFDTIVHLPATGGTPAAVGTTKCKGDVTALTGNLLCAGSGETTTARQLSRWDLAGNGHTVVYALPESSSHVVYIGPSDGTWVYLEANVREGTATNVMKAPLAGGAPVIVACGREEITRRKTQAGSGSNGAYVSELDMVMTPTQLVWTETRKLSGTPHTIAIWRTPR